MEDDLVLEQEEQLEDFRRFSKWTSSTLVAKDIVYETPTAEPSSKTNKSTIVSAFYNCPWTVSCIFRELPDLAKQYVMRLLHKPSGYVIRESDLQTWVVKTNGAQKAHKKAIERLKELRILCTEDVPTATSSSSSSSNSSNSSTSTSTSSKSSPPTAGTKRKREETADLTGGNVKWSLKKDPKVWLHSMFVQQMKLFIHQPRTAPWDADTLTRCGTNAPNGSLPKELEEWATLKWERILHYVVGQNKILLDENDDTSPLIRSSVNISDEIIENLENCMLLGETKDYSKKSKLESYNFEKKTEITQMGYEWMLKNTTSQLWLLIVIHILMTSGEDEGEDSSEDDEDSEEDEEEGGEGGATKQEIKQEINVKTEEDEDEDEKDNDDTPSSSIQMKIDILHLLFRIRCMKLGDSFYENELNSTQINSIHIFEGLGMVRRIAISSGEIVLYPTHLGMTAMEGALPVEQRTKTSNIGFNTSDLDDTTMNLEDYSIVLDTNDNDNGDDVDDFEDNENTTASTSTTSSSTIPLHVVVETNFHVYVYLYTQSPMYEELVKYFIDIHLYTPNMIAGKMTRNSVKSALDKGITSKQILDFIEQHAHPNMIESVKKNQKGPYKGVVPENVRDQLTLWFQETKKARVCDAKLYTNFESVELFEKTVLYAKKIKAYLASHENTETTVIRRDHNQQETRQTIKLWLSIKSKYHSKMSAFVSSNKKGGKQSNKDVNYPSFEKGK